MGKGTANARLPQKAHKKSPERSIFSGLLKCADCGGNLNYHFNQGNPEITYFNCSTYNRGRGECNATHYIRVDFLEQVVLQEINRLTRFASEYEDEFVKAIIGHSMQAAESERAIKQKTLDSLLARDKELDKLIRRLYEDICCKGRLSKSSNTVKASGSSVAE